jgi:hypothetical protein
MSGSMTNGRARRGRTAILPARLRLTLGFRARFPEIDAVRNPLIAHAAIGSQKEHGCSKGHAL